ncbi:MAG: SEC-C metal-binding domain-containing protein [Acidobacteriota bacterium]
MKVIARNDPCPCGSGIKYKKCCLHTGFDRNKKLRVALILTAVVAVIAIALAMLVDRTTAGVVAGIGALGIGAYLVLSNAPPPKAGSGDPGAINFGR